LTVARAAADAAAAVVPASPARVARAAADGARDTLARTPDMLDVLARAGVVDAGGRGLVVLLDALALVLGGEDAVGDVGKDGVEALGQGVSADGSADGSPDGSAQNVGDGLAAGTTRLAAAHEGDDHDGAGYRGPAYEVMYLLDADEVAVDRLRARLASLGDSLVVVGGDGLWNVHVHVDDAGAAVEAGLAAGRPHRVRITHLDARPVPVVPRRVVGLAAGQGLAGLLDGAGAVVLVAEPGSPPSLAEVLAAVRDAGAPEVVLLPNDVGVHAVCEEAATRARRSGLRVAVLPTRSSVQGLAALAVHDAHRGFDDDLVAMTAAAGSTRFGEITVATDDAVTTAGICRTGDVLGLIDGDVVVIGQALDETARAVCSRLLSGGGEMVTLVRGRDTDPALTDDLARHLHDTRPEIDTVVYDGGQPGYPLLVGVE
ncbi:MAG: DAK2 domain-containing protein, partial [Actinomycetes bacterium]